MGGGIDRLGVPNLNARIAHRTRVGMILTGVMLWLFVPIAALLLISMANQSAGFAENEPAWVEPSAATDQIVKTVDIALLWGEPDSIVAPAWSGVVQSVRVRPGQEIDSGQVFATVDGIDRIAWRSEGVFYRRLQIGDEGKDVLWLKRLLIARHSAQTTSDRFDALTLRGVQKLAHDLGVQDTVAAESFDPAWLIYLPATKVSAISISLQIGAPAPSAGTVLVTGRRHLLSTALVDAGSVTSATGSVGGANEARAGLTNVEFHQAVRESGITAGPSDKLESAGQIFGLSATGAALSRASLRNVENTLPEGTRGIVAQLSRPAIPGSLVVPIAAIAAGTSPSVCVMSRTKQTERNVQILGMAPGGTVIESEISPGERVRVPGPSGEWPCPSASQK
jgi:hypothetical protein